MEQKQKNLLPELVHNIPKPSNKFVQDIPKPSNKIFQDKPNIEHEENKQAILFGSVVLGIVGLIIYKIY